MNRSKDWMDQAELDLRHATNSVKIKDFNWVCFAAQQAAEKAIRSLYLHLHMEGWGHVVKDSEKPPHKRFLDYAIDRFPVGCEIFVYTEEELEKKGELKRVGSIPFCLKCNGTYHERI